ncbi:hypothetical protein LCGC14_0724160, partial [marine sediment metagenome]
MGPLLWLDIETTGLSEHQDLLLEVGMILTDEHLRVTASTSIVIGYNRIRELMTNEFVLDMHKRNGLLDAVERSDVTTLRAEQLLLEWVERHSADGFYMAGSGVHFDRRWLTRWMPALVRVWHYRNFDMTTLRYFFEEEKATSDHRAIGDLKQNIADLRRLLG